MVNVNHAVATGRSATRAATTAAPKDTEIVSTVIGRRALAVLRLATGFIFLWAFFDKTFGLGFSTKAADAWINGGTPSQGFLKFAVVGPFTDFFGSIASPFTDVVFQLGMLGVGLAVMLGIGLRVSAVAGTVMMLLMYVAEWVFIPNDASTNPLVDYHIIYALALIIVALLAAGDTWGLGRTWKALPIVKQYPWLV